MASLLETFFIMFESNADKVKRGNDDARRSTDDLEHGLRSADGAGVALGEHLMATFSEIAAGVAAGFGFEKLKDAITEVADLDANLGLLSKRLGINVEDLDAWDRATKLSGGGAGELAGSLDFLNRGMADIATKGTSRLKPFFDELGIAVTDGHKHVRPLLDILKELSDHAQKMGAQQFAGVAEKLGLGPGLTLLIQSGRSNIEDLIRRQKEMGVATADSAARALEYRTANLELDDTFESLYRRIGASVIPAMTDFLKWVMRIVEYLEQHKALVEGFFIGVGVAIGTYYLPAIIEAAVATLAAIGPYLLIAAAVLAVGAAFALAYDDVDAFMKGNKSVLGELLQKYPETFAAIKEALQTTGDVIMWFVHLMQSGFNLISALHATLVNAIVGQLRNWWDALHAIGQLFDATGDVLAKAFPFWEKFFHAIGALIDWVWDKFKEFIGYIGGNAVTTAFGALSELWNGIKNAPGILQTAANFVSNPTGAALAAGQASLAGVAASPYNAAPSTVAGARSNTVSIGTLNVQSPNGTNPTDFADAISRELQNQFRDTINHFDDGQDR